MKRLDTSTVENFAKKEDNLKCDIKLKVESNCNFFPNQSVDGLGSEISQFGTQNDRQRFLAER